MSSATGVPYIISCNCFSSFRGAVHKEGVERTAPLRPRMTRSKRLRSSVNDEELCITHGYVRDARILPFWPCSRSGAHYRLHHRSSEGQYAGRQDYPHHNRNEFQRQRWRGILANLSAIPVRTIQAG